MFTMKFEFERGKEDSLSQLNAALASMRLSSLEIEDSDGYLQTTISYQDGKPSDKSCSYGFDWVEFQCKQENGEPLYVWQIDAAVIPAGEIAESGEYHDLWCAEHPNLAMRTLIKIGFDEQNAFIVTHHERKP